MTVDGLVVWERGTIRLYDCSDGKTPREHYENKDNFIATLGVAKVRDHIAALNATLSHVKFSRPLILKLAAILQAQGFIYVLTERSLGRLMPFATLIEDGYLEGMWAHDIEQILNYKENTHDSP